MPPPDGGEADARAPPRASDGPRAICSSWHGAHGRRPRCPARTATPATPGAAARVADQADQADQAAETAASVPVASARATEGTAVARARPEANPTALRERARRNDPFLGTVSHEP